VKNKEFREGEKGKIENNKVKNKNEENEGIAILKMLKPLKKFKNKRVEILMQEYSKAVTVKRYVCRVRKRWQKTDCVTKHNAFGQTGQRLGYSTSSDASRGQCIRFDRIACSVERKCRGIAVDQRIIQFEAGLVIGDI
jgi:hypothetical protein